MIRFFLGRDRVAIRTKKIDKYVNTAGRNLRADFPQTNPLPRKDRVNTKPPVVPHVSCVRSSTIDVTGRFNIPVSANWRGRGFPCERDRESRRTRQNRRRPCPRRGNASWPAPSCRVVGPESTEKWDILGSRTNWFEKNKTGNNCPQNMFFGVEAIIQ